MSQSQALNTQRTHNALNADGSNSSQTDFDYAAQLGAIKPLDHIGVFILHFCPAPPSQN